MNEWNRVLRRVINQYCFAESPPPRSSSAFPLHSRPLPVRAHFPPAVIHVHNNNRPQPVLRLRQGGRLQVEGTALGVTFSARLHGILPASRLLTNRIGSRRTIASSSLVAESQQTVDLDLGHPWEWSSRHRLVASVEFSSVSRLISSGYYKIIHVELVVGFGEKKKGGGGGWGYILPIACCCFNYYSTSF